MADQPASTPGEKPNQPPSSSAAAPVAPVVETKPAEAKPAEAVKPVEGKPAEPVAPLETKPVEPVKPVEGKPEEKPAEAVKPEAPDVVPEKYELVGFEGKPVDPVLTDALTPILKEAGVKGKQAQALISAYTTYAQTVPALMAARDLEALKADPELGKLNFGRTQSRVNDALAAFTTPEDRAQLTAMGLANNLVLVRMFHRIGAAMGEPPQTDSGARVPEATSRAHKLYGGADAVAPTKPN